MLKFDIKYDRIIIIVYYITVEQQKVLMSIYEEISKTQQNSQKSSYKNFPISDKHQKSYSMKPIQLEVNISIGKNKYLLQVEKCSNLHEEVQQFLKVHGINLKYEGPILTMVREQLTKKDIQKENKYKQKDHGDCQIDQLKQVKHQIDHRKKILEQIQRKQQIQQKQQVHELWNQNGYQKIKKINLSDFSNKQNKQNYPSQYNSTKHGSSIEVPVFSNGHQNVKQPIKQMKEEELKCQNVYERWKVKEKIKETEKAKNLAGQNKNNKQKTSNRSFIKQKEQEKQVKQQDKSKSISQKKLEVHSPDYFYNKGKKFQQLKQENIKQIYKQKYPFQINKDASITPSKKRQLHEKLYKEHKSREEIKMDRKLKEEIADRPKHFVLPTDKYKKRVIQRDNKLNEALSYLLENKMIQNPYKIQRVSKSPFRKTNF